MPPQAPPPFLHAHPDGVHVHIKLQPRASRNQIVGTLENELKIKVTAPPVDAAANEALLRLLAERCCCPRSAVHLVRGHTSRHKVVLMQNLSLEQVAAQLAGGE